MINTFEELPRKTDNHMQKFFIHALMNNEDKASFECIPSKTSNFDLFRYCNPELSVAEANQIFEYYKEQFIKAKLMNINLKGFRKNLGNFVSENYKMDDEFSNGFPSEFKKKYEERRRTDEISNLIGLACYLNLMYTEDKLVEDINNGMTPNEQVALSKRIQGTVPYNNYQSYFLKSNLKFDPSDYKTRKLFVKSHMDYSYKSNHNFICESDVGAVKMNVSLNQNPFLTEFRRRINDGVEINVVTSLMKYSIDEESSYVQITKFFLE